MSKTKCKLLFITVFWISQTFQMYYKTSSLIINRLLLEGILSISKENRIMFNICLPNINR